MLATPVLDRHATYVALSRHCNSVEIIYGRDDFDYERKLVRTLSCERTKDMASVHAITLPTAELPRSPFAGIKPRIWLAPGPQPAPRRIIFAGITIYQPVRLPGAHAARSGR